MSVIRCFWVEREGDGSTVWRRTDTGEVMPHPHAFGPGAMFAADARFAAEEVANGGAKRDDGMMVVVVTPGGEWVVDGCAYDAGGRRPCPWTRSGDPRAPATFSVSPSIHFPGRYHGWLRNGELVDA